MMSQMQPDEVDWKVLLGQLLIAKQQVHENDRDGIESTTLPREKATEADIAAFEARVDGHIDAHYRNFLLHANGWPNVLYDIGLFGLPEFDGAGNWPDANEQLGIYHDEGVLADSGLEADQIVPIAAGEGTIALIVIARPDTKNAGTVVWFDGGEVDRWSNFTEFFLSLIANEQAQAEKLVADNSDSNHSTE